MLTPEQLAILKADITSNPALLADYTAGSPALVSAYYNQLASPSFVVWKQSLSFKEIFEGFIAADWTAMDNLTVGQDRIWINLKELGSISPNSAAHRAAVSECWKGTAAKVAVATRIFDLGKREATRLEKLLATGTGTIADPATAGFEGMIEWPVINQAMES